MAADTCPACHAVEAPPEHQIDRDRIPDDLPIITSSRVLEDRFGLLIVETDVKHIIDPKGLRAVYDVDERVTCSLSDRTPHNYGVVAQVRCGLTLRIGNDCGRKHIEGFEEIDLLARSLHDHARDTRSLDEQPRALLAFYEWLREAARPYFALQNRALREAHPEIAREIVRRSRLEGGQRTEVLVKGEPVRDTGEPGSGRGKNPDYSITLELDFMLMEASTPKILGDFHAVQHFINEVVVADTKSRKIVRGLVATLKRHNEARQHYERWLDSAGVFFTRRNLEALIYATYEPRAARPRSEVVREHEATLTRLSAAFNEARAKSEGAPRPS